MRWFVEVSRVGDSTPAERYCVEAKAWQAALQETRKLRGDSGPLSKFSIELLDDGYRAVDPVQKIRYLVNQAPSDAPLVLPPINGTSFGTPSAPPAAASSVPPAAAKTAPPVAAPVLPSTAPLPAAPALPGAVSAQAAALPAAAPVVPATAAPVVVPPAPVASASASAAAARPTQAVAAAPKATAKARPVGGSSAAASGAGLATATTSSGKGPAIPRPAGGRRADTGAAPQVGGVPTASDVAAVAVAASPAAVSVVADAPVAAMPAVATVPTVAAVPAVAAMPAAAVLPAVVPTVAVAPVVAPAATPPVTPSAAVVPAMPVAAAETPAVASSLATSASAVAMPAAAALPVVSQPVAAAPTLAVAAPAAVVAVPAVVVTAPTVAVPTAAVVPVAAAPAVLVVAPPVEEPSAPVAVAVTAPVTAAPVVAVPTPVAVPTFEVFLTRSQEPKPEAPISYREIACAVAEGTSRDAVEALLRDRLAALQAELSERPSGKLIQLAVFDHAFEQRPLRPPLGTLTWKDWRGEPVFGFPAFGAAAPPVSQSLPPAPPPPPSPTSDPEAGLSNGAGDPHSAELAAANGASASTSSASQGEPEEEEDAQPVLLQRPATSSAADGERISRSKIPIAGRRRAGEDLIGELFELMHELHFARDLVAGADFVMGVLAEVLPCEVAMIQVFNINTRQFVVIRAHGNGLESALLHATPDSDPLLADVMRRGRSRAFKTEGDSRFASGRFKSLKAPLRELLCGPVRQGGRYLGTVELGNPAGGTPFHESETNALDYICEQFAEFVASRPVVLDPDVILAR